MAASLKASKQGIDYIDIARRKKGWLKTDSQWLELSGVSISSLKRFWGKKAIRKNSFVAICEAVEVKWEDILEDGTELISQSPNNRDQGINATGIKLSHEIVSQELLDDLQAIRNKLHLLKTDDEIMDAALSIVIKRLNCQVAAIFRSNKDEVLDRKNIQGVQSDGFPISKEWFKKENYKVGKSLTGRAADDGKGYGKAQSWSKDYGEEPVNEEIKDKYIQLLGDFNCALAVPINGNSKTYGVLRVINKVNSQGKLTNETAFSDEDIHWLSAISSHVSSALIIVRRNKQDLICRGIQNYINQSILSGIKDIAQVDSISKKSNQSYDFNNDIDFFTRVASDLIDQCTAFKMCIIRIKNANNQLEVVAEKGWEVCLENRKTQKILPGELHNKDEIILSKITDEDVDKFNENKEWVKQNNFKSFGCFPILSSNDAEQEILLGTISLYTGYNYSFHDQIKEFLSDIADSIAFFIETYQIRKKGKVIHLNPRSKIKPTSSDSTNKNSQLIFT